MHAMHIKTQPNNVKNHAIYQQVLGLIDDYLPQAGYTKIEVPHLSPALIPESYLEVFETENRYFQTPQKLYLTPSPEFFLKRLVAAGIGNCYSLAKSFRNSEPTAEKHNFEFMMLEFYKVNSDYLNLAEDVLGLFQFIAKNLFGKQELIYQDKKVELDAFEQITVAEAFAQYAGISNIFDENAFFVQAKEKGFRVEKNFSYVDIWSQIYSLAVEPHLGTHGRPTIIYEYPRQLGATAEFDEKKQVAQRLEIYIEGIELGNCGNASTEKTNIAEHKKRMQAEVAERKRMGKIEHPADFEFIEVLQRLPPVSGIAIGVERLAMLFADVKSIQDLKVIMVE
jgi:elongation factor P--(R)-beta-lysine ligase